MIFYDFLKQCADLNENETWSFKPNFQQWPTAKMLIADVHLNNLRSLDPKKKLQLIQFFFDISSKVFRFFWRFFIRFFLYKSVIFIRITDS